ncbi:MAG: DedA family protein [Deltaproteobacteria bacterium]|nr:DedA family protein [Deltaproteobacteria bacterium]
MLKRLYQYILSWANTPYGALALFILAFIESSFFPIPPDILLIALCLSIPAKSFKYALICAAGSTIGGCFGYLIGMKFMSAVGVKIIEFYHIADQFEYIRELYSRYDAWAVGIAGFTPIPYKVFTITAGVFNIDFKVFLFASLISRGLRFFLVGWLIFAMGEKIKPFIDKYFNTLAVIFVILLILGFALIKFIL